MVNFSAPSRQLRLVILLLSVLFVLCFDALWTGKRYPYAADSSSYIEMADSLYHQGQPLVTPWDFSEGSAEQMPQKLFPPGYPVLVAAFIPFTGVARTAALVPPRLAAMLLPLLVLALFAGVMPARSLALFALYTLLTSGVRGWQFMAYSDVPALALSVLALGALARGLGLVATARRPLAWCVLAGLAAGSAYTVRNAGIAVLAITVVMLAESLWRRAAWREALAVVVGAAAPLTALIAYNLAAFGQWQPYAMPPSTRPWTVNVMDWARATFTDLGMPWQVAEPLPHWVAPIVMVGVLCTLAVAFFRLSSDPKRRALLLLLGGYAAGGALLLVVSRSRYEWGNTIDERNTLQYTWALVFALLLAVPVVFDLKIVQGLRRAGLVFFAFVAALSVHDAWVVGMAPAEWWQVLAADTQVINAAVGPRGTLMASNQAVLFRIGAAAPVRNFEIGGTDTELHAALQVVQHEASGRPAKLLLVCDQYTRGYSICGGAPVTGKPLPACALVRTLSPRVAVCPIDAREASFP